MQYPDEPFKMEVKIDPLDFHEGLKDKMAGFESFIRTRERPTEKLIKNLKKQLNSRFCHCCFFGPVHGQIMGEPLCKMCAKELYGFDGNDEKPCIKKMDPVFQLWYRRKMALPVFEAYLHSELGRWKAENALDEYMHGKGNKEGK